MRQKPKTDLTESRSRRAWWRKGNAVIGTSTSLIALLVALVMYLKGETNNENAFRKADETFLAYNSATELLEFLRSFRQMRLYQYLKINPVTSSPTNPTPAAADSYYYCAHYNLLQKGTTNILNKNTIADMPPSPLDKGTAKANRFFQVQVIDKTTFVVDKEFCKLQGGNVALGTGTGQFDDTKHRYLVTVGVSWVEHGTTVTDPLTADRKRVTLSTIIPE